MIAPELSRRTLLKSVAGTTIGLPLAGRDAGPPRTCRGAGEVGSRPRIQPVLRVGNSGAAPGGRLRRSARAAQAAQQKAADHAQRQSVALRQEGHERSLRRSGRGVYRRAAGRRSAVGRPVDRPGRSGEAHYPRGCPPGWCRRWSPARSSAAAAFAATFTATEWTAPWPARCRNGRATCSIASLERVALAGGDSDDARSERLRRSVLDSVVEDYRFYTGDNSPLGAASKSRVAEHLERVREFELRAFALKDSQRNGPAVAAAFANSHTTARPTPAVRASTSRSTN